MATKESWGKKAMDRLKREGSKSSTTSEPVQAASLSTSSTAVATAANLRTEQFGLFRLDTPSASTTSPSLDDNNNNNNQHGQFPVDIIAVHGLNGDAYSTWTHGNGTFWLRDLLPSFLPGCRVYTYGYPSQTAFTRSYADVSAYARRLLNSIRGLSEDWNEGPRSFVFVCHSLGGIVFKQALVCAHEDNMAVLASIAGVVFCGTPHGGSDLAGTGAIAGRIINTFTKVASAGLQNGVIRSDILRYLSLHSEKLHDLSLSVRNRLLNMTVVSFYETKGLSPFNWLIVDKENACLEIPGEDVVPLYEDHRSMCRFGGETDSYKAVAKAIRRIAAAARDKAQIQRRHMDERSSARSSLRSLTETETACVALFRPFDVDDHRRKLPQPATGTCHWILRHPVFLSWLEKEDSAPLWLRGHPGCGKTVLSLFLAGHFEAWQSPLAPTNVCIYFCDDKITKQKDANAILSGLIFQIICRHRSLIRHVKRVFEIRGPAMRWSFSALWSVLLKIISDPKCGPTCFIIDALDECEQTSRCSLLESIHTFLQASSHETRTKNRVKFILTSRPSIVGQETLAEQAADHQIFIDESQEGYLEALNAFIQRRVDTISLKQRLPPKVKTFLEENLVSRAGETFLWADMVLTWLGESSLVSEKVVQDALKRIPPNLETTYSGFLDNIAQEHQSAAAKFLLLILGSARPLSLEELNIAFTVQESHRTVEDVASESQTAIQRAIQAVLGPLVRASESRVSLVHQTVKDFILQQRHLDKTPLVLRQINAESAALSIVTACVRYLLLEDFSGDLYCHDDESSLESPISPPGSSEGHSLDDEKDQLGMVAMFKEPELVVEDICQVLADKYAFYRYASLHWAEHYAICEASAPAELKDAARSLLDITTPHGANWWRFFTADAEHQSQDLPRRPSSRLTLAAFFNLRTALTEELAQQPSPPSSSPSAARNDALFWASYEGHTSIVEALLTAGADPNAQNLNRHTPLTIASRHGHLACVAALLRHPPTDVNARGEKGRTALSLACSNQHPDIVRTLLGAARCDASLQDDLGATALHWACRVADNDAVVAALLQHPTVSVSLNTRDKDGRTALSWAAGWGVKMAVKTLLRVAAVDANLADSKGRSPLSWAAGNGCSSTVRALLQNSRVDTSAVDIDGRNAFSWAAGGGHADVLQVLLKNGCPGVDEPDVDRWTPLAWATRIADPGATKVLVATRAVDLERRDKGGLTALAWAVGSGHCYVVRALLGAGANPFSVSNSGETPMSMARRPGWERTLNELLRYTERKVEAQVGV